MTRSKIRMLSELDKQKPLALRDRGYWKGQLQLLQGVQSWKTFLVVKDLRGLATPTLNRSEYKHMASTLHISGLVSNTSLDGGFCLLCFKTSRYRPIPVFTLGPGRPMFASRADYLHYRFRILY